MNSSVTAIVTYIYDIWGNILTTTGAMATTLGTRPLRYCGYVYDGSTLVWKEGRRLQSITKDGKTASYIYDADGQRTRKTYPDGSYTKFCVVDGRVVGEIIYKKTANGVKWNHGMRYIYGDDGSVVGFGLWDANTTNEWERYYFVKNLQGDVLKVYRDADNALVASYTYDPFGNILTKSGEMADENPFRYRGYYYDTETGFYYLQSRYYDPLTCRFISADSYASTGQGILGCNMFTYCGNNPANCADPSGMFWKEIKSWFKGAWNTVTTWASNTFGAGSSTSTSITQEHTYIPDPSPITVKAGTTNTQTISEHGNSEKPISVYAEGDAEHPIKSSTAGIKVNIAKFTLNFSYGLDNMGTTGSITNGNTTNSIALRTNLSELKVGVECSSSIQQGNTTQTQYTNINVSGWAIAAIYLWITSGQVISSPSYFYGP